MKNLKKISKYVIPAVMAVVPMLSFAAAIVQPTTGVGGPALDLTEIQGIITTIANYLIVVGMVVAVIAIVWGGIKWMTAQGDPKKAEAARGAILHGVLGAIIILAVGVILNTAAALVARTFFS